MSRSHDDGKQTSLTRNDRPESEGPESLEDEESQFVNEFKHEVEIPHIIPQWLWGVCLFIGLTVGSLSSCCLQGKRHHAHPMIPIKFPNREAADPIVCEFM